MATGGSVSHTKDSEYFYEYCCKPCSRRKNGGCVREAVNQCVECNEYLCKKCTKVHNRLGATSDHNVLRLVELRKCKAHGGESITTYCAYHDVVCCKTGELESHKKCADTRYIVEAAVGIKSSKQVHTTKSIIKSTLKEAKRKKMSRQTDQETLDKEKAASIQQVRDFTERQIQRLRELEKVTIEEINNKHKEFSSHVSGEVGSLEEVIFNLEEDQQKLNCSQDMQESQVFVDIKQSQLHETEAREILRQPSKPHSLMIRLKVSIERTLNDISSLGSFYDDNIVYNAKLKSNINVKMKQDTEKCNISGSCQLLDGTVAITDGNNKRLKRLDASYRVTDQCDMPDQPYGVTCTVPDEVAVTMPSLKKVQFVSVRESLSLTRSFRTSECCRGIHYIAGKLYISCVDVNKKETAHVAVFNLQGQRVSVIQNDSCGQQTFSRPAHICASLDDVSIYVADLDDCVKLLDKNETLTGTISIAALIDARGVCAVDSGHILVCGYTSNNVLQFDSDGRKVTELLKVGDGIQKPQSLCYNLNSSTLIVTMKDTDYIKVFQLT